MRNAGFLHGQNHHNINLKTQVCALQSPKENFKPHREPQHQMTKHNAKRLRENNCKLVGKAYLQFFSQSKPGQGLSHVALPHTSAPAINQLNPELEVWQQWKLQTNT